MKKPFVILHGLSGSGKSTCSSILNAEYGLASIHPITHLKTFVETSYGLPLGALESYQYKTLTIPGTTITYHELLKDLFLFFQGRDPAFSSRMTRVVLLDLIEKDTNFSIMSLRHKYEQDVLLSLCKEFDLKYLFINLERASAIEKESDVYFNGLSNILRNNDYCIDACVIKNNQTISNLTTNLINFCNDYLKPSIVPIVKP